MVFQIGAGGITGRAAVTGAGVRGPSFSGAIISGRGRATSEGAGAGKARCRDVCAVWREPQEGG